MLNSRYLALHEALQLGPMWLQRNARLVETGQPQLDTRENTSPDRAQRQPGQMTARMMQCPDLQSEPAPPARHPARVKTTPPVKIAEISETPAATLPIADLSPDTETLLQTLPGETFSTLLASCMRCALAGERRHPLEGRGSLQATLMVIGQNPDLKGEDGSRLFGGDTGLLLDQIIMAAGFDPADVFYTTRVKCTPNVSLRTDDVHAASCSPFLLQQIRHIRPEAVLLVGNRFKDALPDDLSDALARIPYGVIPHPARMLRNAVLKIEAWKGIQTIRRTKTYSAGQH